MTVQSETARQDYLGNSVTTVFSVPFRFLADNQLRVLRTVIATGVTTELVLNSLGSDGYSVTGAGKPAGGSITTVTAPAGPVPTPALAERLSILRNVPITQLIDYIANDAFPAESHESGLDKLTMILQQQGEVVERAVVLPAQSVGVNNELPGPAALHFLRWKADLSGLENAAPPQIATVADGAVVDATVSPIAGIQSTKLSFIQAGVGAAPRSVQDKLREVVSLKDFYQTTDGADWLAAFNRAIAYLSGLGGGRLYIPSGTYPVSGTIDISGLDNLWIDGCGQDNTILTTTSATLTLFYSSFDRKYRKFSNFTVASSVTRTAGAMFDFLAERRTIMTDLKITGHFDGIIMRGFEETEINRVRIVKPSGAGVALTVGTFGLFGSGANLHVTGCFFRGGDDLAATPPVGSLGLRVFDCDALFMFDTDVGGFIDGGMSVNASVRAANFFFTQCFFDATKTGHCITVFGAGVKDKWAFANCWIGGGGILSGGAADACGLLLADQGSYAGLQFTGCRFHLSNGSGVNIGRAGSIQFTGCNFESNGSGGSGNQFGFKYSPSVAVGPGPLLSGCFFSSNTPSAIQVNSNAREVVISGCSIDNGASISGGTTKFVSGFDKTVNAYASANPLNISHFHSFMVVNGTTNIGTITPTFTGHRITIFFTAILTMVDGSGNLRLAGNFVTAGGSTLTLICDGAEWIETSRANT